MKKVVITGAGGQIGQQLAFKLPTLFQEECELVLLDLPNIVETLEWMKMELEDCAFPFLKKISITSSQEEAFRDSTYIICVGAFPRKEGMQRSDLLIKNASIFKEQGLNIEKFANKKVKVLVVGNPCNTNAYILSKFLSQEKNVFCLTTLDELRAKTIVAKELHTRPGNISNIFIWGNHSLTQYPLIHEALFQGKKIDFDQNVVIKMIKEVRERGAVVIKAKGSSSSCSAAESIIQATKNLFFNYETPFSMGVISQGEYGIEKGLCFSFPCKNLQGKVQVLENFSLTTEDLKEIKISEEELKKEKDLLGNFF